MLSEKASALPEPFCFCPEKPGLTAALPWSYGIVNAHTAPKNRLAKHHRLPDRKELAIKSGEGHLAQERDSDDRRNSAIPVSGVDGICGVERPAHDDDLQSRLVASDR